MNIYIDSRSESNLDKLITSEKFERQVAAYHGARCAHDDYLRIWQACWAPGKVSFPGRFMTFADMHARPEPLQQPHPPIWVGGSSDAALGRAAAFATVWQPAPTPVADLVDQEFLREACPPIDRRHPPE